MRSFLAALGALFAASIAGPAVAQFTPVGVGPIHSSGPGTFTFLSHTATTVNTVDSGQTPNINATGGKLIVVNVVEYVGSGTTACTAIVDSSGNTYTPGTPQNDYTDNVFQVRLWWKISPTVTSAMHWDCPGTGTQPAISVQVWGDTGTPTFDSEAPGSTTGSGTGVFTIGAGNITSTVNGELFVGGVNWSNLTGSTISIDSCCTITDSNGSYAAAPGVQNFGMAYLIEPTPTTVNPAWGNDVGGDAAAVMASFKP